MNDIVKDITRFSVTLAAFVYVVFWMNANPWWIALGTFLYMFTMKHSQPVEQPVGCSRKSCCKQKNDNNSNT